MSRCIIGGKNREKNQLIAIVSPDFVPDFDQTHMSDEIERKVLSLYALGSIDPSGPIDPVLRHLLNGLDCNRGTQ